MPNVVTEIMYGTVSALVSSIDGVQAHTVQIQPGILVPSVSAGIANSAPQTTMLEFWRRMVTRVLSVSCTLNSGGSAAAVQLNFATVTPSGFWGILQGVPFVLSGTANTLSAAVPSNASTTSTQIRKVLVTVGMSGLPVTGSGFALAGGTLQFIVGSAMATSALGATSGGQAASFFDFVPLPLPSAGEVPVGWLNIPNSYTVSGGIFNSWMQNDLRAIQGVNLSALMQGLPQP